MRGDENAAQPVNAFLGPLKVFHRQFYKSQPESYSLPWRFYLPNFKRYAHAAGPFNNQFRGGRYWFQLGMHNAQRTTRAAVEASHFRYRASHIHARAHFELAADLSSESSCACQALVVRTAP